MKTINSLLIIFILIGCSKSKTEFYSCANNAGMFSHKDIYIVSLDTLRNYQKFKNYSETVRDTISNCALMYGFIYNYEDSSFIPNKEGNKNIVISAFDIISNHCVIDYSIPRMELLIKSSDSIEIYSTRKKTSRVYELSGLDLNHVLDSFYYELINQDQIKSYIRIVLNDTMDMNECLLPCVRTLIKYYKINVERYLEENNLDICDTLIFNRYNDKILHLGFRLRIDDFDYREIYKLQLGQK